MMRLTGRVVLASGIDVTSPIVASDNDDAPVLQRLQGRVPPPGRHGRRLGPVARLVGARVEEPDGPAAVAVAVRVTGSGRDGQTAVDDALVPADAAQSISMSSWH